jgi:hypothetical protein
MKLQHPSVGEIGWFLGCGLLPPPKRTLFAEFGSVSESALVKRELPETDPFMFLTVILQQASATQSWADLHINGSLRRKVSQIGF